MNNCWKVMILVGATIFAILKLQSLRSIASSAEPKKIQTNEDSATVLAQKIPICSQLTPKHLEVYAFETQRSFISICQTEDEFLYVRQSKSDPEELLILPAIAVFGDTVFQAIDGKTIYFVGIDANGHYSSVMQQDDEMVFEPEILPTTTELPSNDIPSQTFTENIPLMTDSEADRQHNTLDFDEETNWEICDRNQNSFYPLLNSWQRLIGTEAKTTSNCQIPSQLN